MSKLSILLSVFILITAIGAANNKVIDFGEAPAELQQFIGKHFSTQEILKVEKDDDSYDVYLGNGVELEFDKTGDWIEVDAKNKAIPLSVIDLLPSKISDYVNQNYQSREIEKISKKKNGFKISLLGSPKIELIFDHEGRFMKVDD